MADTTVRKWRFRRRKEATIEVAFGTNLLIKVRNQAPPKWKTLQTISSDARAWILERFYVNKKISATNERITEFRRWLLNLLYAVRLPMLIVYYCGPAIEYATTMASRAILSTFFGFRSVVDIGKMIGKALRFSEKNKKDLLNKLIHRPAELTPEEKYSLIAHLNKIMGTKSIGYSDVTMLDAAQLGVVGEVIAGLEDPENRITHNRHGEEISRFSVAMTFIFGSLDAALCLARSVLIFIPPAAPIAIFLNSLYEGWSMVKSGVRTAIQCFRFCSDNYRAEELKNPHASTAQKLTAALTFSPEQKKVRNKKLVKFGVEAFFAIAWIAVGFTALLPFPLGPLLATVFGITLVVLRYAYRTHVKSQEKLEADRKAAMERSAITNSENELLLGNEHSRSLEDTASLATSDQELSTSSDDEKSAKKRKQPSFFDVNLVPRAPLGQRRTSIRVKILDDDLSAQPKAPLIPGDPHPKAFAPKSPTPITSSSPDPSVSPPPRNFEPISLTRRTNLFPPIQIQSGRSDQDLSGLDDTIHSPRLMLVGGSEKGAE